MAMEDALTLAVVLANGRLTSTDVARAHGEYVAARHDRVRRVQLDSRRLGQIAGWSAWPAVWLRDLGLRVAPERASLSHYRALAAPGLALCKQLAALAR